MSESTQIPEKQTVAADFSSIRKHAEEYLVEVHEFLMEQVKEFEPEVQELASYCLSKGGKRIRPVLVYFSGYQGREIRKSDLIKIGAVIEMVHTATLVHDDILDQASMRHGQESAPEKYGPAVAVLLGDALFSHALRLAAEFPTVEVCREVATSTRTVCAGEIHQTFSRGDAEITLADYYRCIEMKTAELFRVACHLGAKVGGEDSDFVEACGKFGNHLGTAYQIFDDYADLFSTEQRMGKTLMTDLLKGKYTLPVILLFEALPEVERKELKKQLNNSESASVDVLNPLMDNYQIKGKVMEAFEREIRLGEEALAPYEGSQATDRLSELLAFVRAQISILS